VTDERISIVEAGYDSMADTWETWSSRVTDDPREAWLERLVTRLPDGADVLELGCGNGTLETRELARRFRLTGIDVSEEQLRRARERVPEATFERHDLTTMDRAHGSLDAVCALYVFGHVPRELLADVFDRIHDWLRPGGLLLASLGSTDVAEWRGEWLGVPMYFSSFAPPENRRLLSAFELLEDEVVTIVEPEGPVSFQWILARR
jgi:SAM-dependent methyltransferase